MTKLALLSKIRHGGYNKKNENWLWPVPASRFSCAQVWQQNRWPKFTLVINVEKSAALLICPSAKKSNHLPSTPPILLCGTPVNVVTEMRLLGVIVDNQLSWSSQVNTATVYSLSSLLSFSFCFIVSSLVVLSLSNCPHLEQAAFFCHLFYVSLFLSISSSTLLCLSYVHLWSLFVIFSHSFRWLFVPCFFFFFCVCVCVVISIPRGKAPD